MVCAEGSTPLGESPAIKASFTCTVRMSVIGLSSLSFARRLIRQHNNDGETRVAVLAV